MMAIPMLAHQIGGPVLDAASGDGSREEVCEIGEFDQLAFGECGAGLDHPLSTTDELAGAAGRVR
jgi:hypothetical protein